MGRYNYRGHIVYDSIGTRIKKFIAKKIKYFLILVFGTFGQFKKSNKYKSHQGKAERQQRVKQLKRQELKQRLKHEKKNSN